MLEILTPYLPLLVITLFLFVITIIILIIILYRKTNKIQTNLDNLQISTNNTLATLNSSLNFTDSKFNKIMDSDGNINLPIGKEIRLNSTNNQWGLGVLTGDNELVRIYQKDQNKDIWNSKNYFDIGYNKGVRSY
jgi:predicted PurR-regulated permease PerM